MSHCEKGQIIQNCYRYNLLFLEIFRRIIIEYSPGELFEVVAFSHSFQFRADMDSSDCFHRGHSYCCLDPFSLLLGFGRGNIIVEPKPMGVEVWRATWRRFFSFCCVCFFSFWWIPKICLQPFFFFVVDDDEDDAEGVGWIKSIRFPSSGVKTKSLRAGTPLASSSLVSSSHSVSSSSIMSSR
jgi:hypothetical protein